MPSVAFLAEGRPLVDCEKVFCSDLEASNVTCEQ